VSAQEAGPNFTGIPVEGSGINGRIFLCYFCDGIKSQRSLEPQANRPIGLHVLIAGSHVDWCVHSHDFGSLL
jgi:hypothetical protein